MGDNCFTTLHQFLLCTHVNGLCEHIYSRPPPPPRPLGHLRAPGRAAARDGQQCPARYLCHTWQCVCVSRLLSQFLFLSKTITTESASWPCWLRSGANRGSKEHVVGEPRITGFESWKGPPKPSRATVIYPVVGWTSKKSAAEHPSLP